MDFLNKSNNKLNFYVPKIIVDIYDFYAFKREIKKNKLHWNCYYHKSMYHKPLNLNQVLKNIFKNHHAN